MLLDRIEENPNITLLENHMAVDLLTKTKLVRRGIVASETRETCWGAYVLDVIEGQVITYIARTTVLATGGGR